MYIAQVICLHCEAGGGTKFRRFCLPQRDVKSPSRLDAAILVRFHRKGSGTKQRRLFISPDRLAGGLFRLHPRDYPRSIFRECYERGF